MLFPRRVERAMKLSGKKRDDNNEQLEEDAALIDHMEKGDLPAMILSALLILVPVAAIVLLLMVFAGIFLMRL